MTIIYVIVIFCFLIFIHELGHFVAAKKLGVKVNEFALGMGPIILKKQGKETLYSLRAFPIGGFCAMEGEDEASEDPRAFSNKKAIPKAIILAAGAFMNLVTAIVLFIVLSFMAGSPTTTLDDVSKDMPAYNAGLQKGDTIEAIDGKKVDSWEDITKYIGSTEGESFDVLVSRGDEELSFNIKADNIDGRYIVGIAPASERSFIYAVKDGFSRTGRTVGVMMNMLKDLFSGKESVKNLSGPVGIIYVINDASGHGIGAIIFLTAFISLNLAIVNMLPWPALDGGRILFLLIRKITGKAMDDNLEGKFHFVGIIILFALMIYVTWQDIIRFVIPIFG